MADCVIINSWNWFFAAPEFRLVDPRAGTLDMEYGAAITSRHYIDASGTIIMKPHARIGGGRAFLQTHELDFGLNRQAVGRIVIGHHALVSTCAVMLKGAHLPDQSLLAANSTMVAANTDEHRRGLYAGCPATWRRDTQGHYFVSTAHVMTEFVVEGPMGPEKDELPSLNGIPDQSANRRSIS